MVDSSLYDTDSFWDALQRTEEIVTKRLEKDSGGRKPWTLKVCEEFANFKFYDLLFNKYFLWGIYEKQLIYPGILDLIYEIWEIKQKSRLDCIVLLCAVGVGKSTLNAILQWLQWYELTTKYFDFRKAFQLTGKTPTCLVQLSVKEDTAKKVTFEKIYPLFQCGFNLDYFTPDKNVKSEIRIRRNQTLIFPGSARRATVLGYDIYSGCIDEASAMGVTQDSVFGDTGNREYDRAKDVFYELDERIGSRFGGNRGAIIMISQRRTGREFVEEHYRRIEREEVPYSYARKLSFVDVVGWGNKKFFPSGEVAYFNINTFEVIEDKKQIEEITNRKGILDAKSTTK
jgi:hypothetical protein